MFFERRGRRTVPPIFLVWALVAPASPALAQLTVTGFIGRSTTLQSKLEWQSHDGLSHLVFEGVAWESEPFETPIYYGVRLAYFLPSVRWLRLEAEFIHDKVITRTGETVTTRGTMAGASISGRGLLSATFPRLAATHGMNYLFANGALRYQLGTGGITPGRVDLVARAGLGPTLPHVETTAFNESREEYQYGGLAIQLGGGATFRLTSRVGFVIEYKYSSVAWSFDTGTGEGKTRLGTHHVVFGPTLEI